MREKSAQHLETEKLVERIAPVLTANAIKTRLATFAEKLKKLPEAKAEKFWKLLRRFLVEKLKNINPVVLAQLQHNLISRLSLFERQINSPRPSVSSHTEKTPVAIPKGEFKVERNGNLLTKNDPNLQMDKKYYQSMVIKDPQLIFEANKEIKKLFTGNEYKNLIEQAAKAACKEPDIFFNNSEVIEKALNTATYQKFVQEAATNAAKIDRDTFFKNLTTIIKHLSPQILRNLVIQACKDQITQKPYYIFKYSEQIKQVLGIVHHREITKKAAIIAAEKDPKELFYFLTAIRTLIDQKTIMALVYRAATNASEKKPSLFLRYSNLIKSILGEKIHKELMINAVRKAAKIDPTSFFNDIEEIKKTLGQDLKESLVKEVSEKLLEEQAHDILISRYNNISSYPWAFKLLEQIIRKRPEINLPKGLRFTAIQSRQLAIARQEGNHLLIIARNATANNPHPLRFGLLADPALIHLGKIKREWMQAALRKSKNPLFLNKKFISSMKLIVARNLFFQKIPISKEIVQKEITRILANREKFKNIPIFKGRNVLFAAHIEILSDFEQTYYNINDPHKFGRKEIIDSINQQGGKASLERPAANSPEALAKTKKQIIEKFINTKPPFTFVFDGHGGPNALYLSDGTVSGGKIEENKKTTKITIKELRDMYLRRRQKFPQSLSASPDKKDIMIFGTCFNHTFLRRFYDLLPPNVPKPITLGQSEYGQLAYSESGNSFFKKTLNLGSAKTSTFQDVFNGDFTQQNSNPSFYIPNQRNIPQQISQKGKNRPSSQGIA